MASDLTDKLDAMVAVAKKATPGHWFPFCKRKTTAVLVAPDARKGEIVHWTGFDSATAKGATSRRKMNANAAHIAQSNPTVFTALCGVARAADDVINGDVLSSQKSGSLLKLDHALTALETALSEADDD